MSIKSRLQLTFVLTGLGLLFGSTAHATTCTIGFSQSSGLNAMPAAQAYGFATAPWYTAICGGSNFVNTFLVDENGGDVFNHYHIWAEDPTVNCFTTSSAWPEGVMGRQVGTGPCVAVNPLTTSREAGVHTTTHWLRIRSNNANRWRATQIQVLGTEPVRVLLEQANGTFWQYTNLTPGTWNLSSTGQFAKNAWVMNQTTATGVPMSFDNFVVDHNL